MDPVHRAVSRFLAAQSVGRGARVLVALSGGADSVALLHALVALGQRVGAAHVHHGLRGADADADQAFAAELAHALGVPFHAARVDAAQRDARSPEARARALRYAALERIRGEHDYAHLATAHHRDDQAETVLLRAARGSGVGGLAGIRPSLDRGRVLRPLLEVSRAELRAYLSQRGLVHREDASNGALAIPRNRVRARLLPELESALPGASANLAALATRAAETDAALAALLDERLEPALAPGDGGLWLERAALLALPDAARPAALARFATRAGLGEGSSSAELRRCAEQLAHGRAGARLALAGGAALFVDRERVWLGPGPGPRFPAPVRVPLAGEGVLECPERGIRLYWRTCRGDERAPRHMRFVTPPSAALVARSAEPGDRLRLGDRERALKELFSRARWSLERRARALVVEREGEIVWVPGLASCASEMRVQTPLLELRAERLSSLQRSC